MVSMSRLGMWPIREGDTADHPEPSATSRRLGAFRKLGTVSHFVDVSL
jgi:hypothetical protein